MTEHDGALAASNLADVPTIVRAGSADTTITPWFSRRIARVLSEVNAPRPSRMHWRGPQQRGNTSWSEIKHDANSEPAGHWWWDTKTTNDGGVVNDAALRKFVGKAMAAEARSLALGAGAVPREEAYASAAGWGWSVTALNVGTTHARRGFRILQQRHSFRLARLSVRAAAAEHFTASGTPAAAQGVWQVDATRNVRRFAFCPPAAPAVWPWAPATALLLDGTRIPLRNSAAAENGGCWHFCWAAAGGNAGSSWSDCSASASTYTETERSPSTYGPMRQVFMAPFVIVAGTGGGADSAATMLEVATYLAVSHYSSVRSYAPIVLDTEVDTTTEPRHLILVGGPKLNSVTRWLSGCAQRANDSACGSAKFVAPPVQFVDGGYRLGPCAFTAEAGEDGLGLAFVTPLPTPHAAREKAGDARCDF